MTLKQRLLAQLKRGRKFSEGLLSVFQTPEDWTYQVAPEANHALWFAGHIAWVENFMVSLVVAERARQLPDRWTEQFGMGSIPSPRAADYPPIDEVLECFRERRATLLDILESLADADLDRPTREGAPPFMPDFGAVFQGAAWHEAMHAGQITVARRALGHPNVSGR